MNGRRRRAGALTVFLPMAAFAFGAAVVAAAEPAAPLVRTLGPQFLNNSVNVTGADGATSLLLPDGRSLWVFGDTVEGPFTSIRQLDLAPLASNTGALAPVQDAAEGICQFHFIATADGKRPQQLIPFAADDDPARTRLWAVHGACVGDNVYLFYHRITLLEGVDVFVNFRLEGMGLARVGLVDASDWRFTRLAAPDGSREFWKGDQPSFGVWVERDGDQLYLWGSLMTGMFLARVSADQIENLAAYEYLVDAPTNERPDKQPRWSRNFAPSAVLFDSVPNEMSVSFNRHLDKYLAIHALGREGTIAMRTADRRTGPWSAPAVLYEAPRANPEDLVYATKEHPELAQDGGRRIYVTFVNSSTYVPQLIEVILP